MVPCIVNLVPNIGAVTATTNCGGPVEVTASQPTLISGTDDCDGARYSVTYTVTDDCGRSVSRDQICTLDNDAPEFVCPVDICVIECPANTDMIQAQFDAYAGLATVNTSCVGQEVSISNNFNPNGSKLSSFIVRSVLSVLCLVQLMFSFAIVLHHTRRWMLVCKVAERL